MLRMFTESRFAPALTVALAMPLLVTISCRRAETAPAPQATQPITHPATPSGPPPSVASPHGASAVAGGDPSSPTIETPQVRFDLPARWRREPPSSGARLAQAVIPGEAGPGELAVFYFGADRGGSVESNFDRWKGQMRSPAGSPPTPPETGTVESAAAGPAGPVFRASWIDVSGTMMPTGMGGPTEEQPNFRLLGAVVEGPGGPWFFKATGPASTLAAARGEFLDILRSARSARPAQRE